MCKNCAKCCGREDDRENCESCRTMSHSTLMGPSIDEVLVYLICCLGASFAESLSFIHDKCTGQAQPDCFDMGSWLKKETCALAQEMVCHGLETREGRACQARKFVFQRLAELMAKKEELEMCRKTGPC